MAVALAPHAGLASADPQRVVGYYFEVLPLDAVYAVKTNYYTVYVHKTLNYVEFPTENYSIVGVLGPTGACFVDGSSADVVRDGDSMTVYVRLGCGSGLTYRFSPTGYRIQSAAGERLLIKNTTDSPRFPGEVRPASVPGVFVLLSPNVTAEFGPAPSLGRASIERRGDAIYVSGTNIIIDGVGPANLSDFRIPLDGTLHSVRDAEGERSFVAASVGDVAAAALIAIALLGVSLALAGPRYAAIVGAYFLALVAFFVAHGQMGNDYALIARVVGKLTSNMEFVTDFNPWPNVFPFLPLYLPHTEPMYYFYVATLARIMTPSFAVTAADPLAYLIAAAVVAAALRGGRRAEIAATLIAIEPFFFVNAAMPGGGHVLASAMAVGAVTALSREDLRSRLLGGAIAGALALTRAEIGAAILAAVVISELRRVGVSESVRRIAPAVIAAAAAVSPWFLRNYAVFGTPFYVQHSIVRIPGIERAGISLGVLWGVVIGLAAFAKTAPLAASFLLGSLRARRREAEILGLSVLLTAALMAMTHYPWMGRVYVAYIPAIYVAALSGGVPRLRKMAPVLVAALLLTFPFIAYSAYAGIGDERVFFSYHAAAVAFNQAGGAPGDMVFARTPVFPYLTATWGSSPIGAFLWGGANVSGWMVIDHEIAGLRRWLNATGANVTLIAVCEQLHRAWLYQVEMNGSVAILPNTPIRPGLERAANTAMSLLAPAAVAAAMVAAWLRRDLDDADRTEDYLRYAALTVPMLAPPPYGPIIAALGFIGQSEAHIARRVSLVVGTALLVSAARMNYWCVDFVPQALWAYTSQLGNAAPASALALAAVVFVLGAVRPSHDVKRIYDAISRASDGALERVVRLLTEDY